MTQDTQAALRAAVNALKAVDRARITDSSEDWSRATKMADDAIAVAEVALEQPAGEVEPVAWRYEQANAIANGVYCGWKWRLGDCAPRAPEGSIRSLTPLYAHPPALDAEAIRRAALEGAAKACDRIAGNTADFPAAHRRAAGQCAAAIRALAEKEPTDADSP